MRFLRALLYYYVTKCINASQIIIVSLTKSLSKNCQTKAKEVLEISSQMRPAIRVASQGS